MGEATFGYDRYLNQALYCSSYWKRIRNNVILRDGACDLGIKGYDLYGNITVHHMNPITMDMINDRHEYVANEEYLICVSFDTHNAIHFGSRTGADITSKWKIIERTPNDTIPWR
ncbi:MAG: hypothetical protein LBD57_04205 [Endomicrobium sp.]|uniref:hypothetical protein n=1 Tax=Candidatus Endomicrobiellum cubanum TaxID=3242325 RepID=UPI002818485B|nr:hypothetical protein [Endomicrobium sp.]